MNKLIIYLATFLMMPSLAKASEAESVVKLRINDIDIATAFFIDKNGTLLTAYHAICGHQGQRTHSIEAFINEKSIGKPVVIGYSPLNDLALLKLNRVSTPLKLAQDRSSTNALLKSAKEMLGAIQMENLYTELMST